MSDTGGESGAPGRDGSYAEPVEERDGSDAEPVEERDGSDAEPNEEPVDERATTGSDAGEQAGRPSRRFGVLAGVLSVALIALIALSALFGVQWSQERDQEQRRQAALAAAKQTVLNLTTLSAQSAERDVKRLLSGATGEFKKKFGSRREAFIKLLQQAKVKTTGEVVAAGITTATEESARVLVAATAQVSNSQASQAQPRSYRMAVELQHKDGQWLASGLEFVR